MVTARDNLHHATLELVRSTPIKQRLICAYRRYLAGIHAEQLPSDVRVPFGRVVQCLSGVTPLRGEDPVVAAVRKMSNQDADECAALIVEMFGTMCRAESVASRAVNAATKLHSISSDIESETGEYAIPAQFASN